MAAENSVGELPPGFDNVPSANTLPLTIDGSVKQILVSAEDEQDEGHDNSTTRRSLRTRASPDFFAPYHSSVRCDTTYQPVKRGRGRGRPGSRRPVSSYAPSMNETPSLVRGDGTAQLIKRGPGRPRKRRPISSHELPPEFDHTPLANTLPSTVDQSAKRARHCPPEKISVSAQGVVHVEALTNETPTVPLTPMPSSGSSIDVPLLIPCDADEDQRDKKINLNPLSKLNPSPNPQKECPSHITEDEETKSMISKVKSVLVFHLTSKRARSIKDMVDRANNAFFDLDSLNADYASFYKDVKDLISYKCDLLTVQRQREIKCFPELKTQYENAIICANKLQDKINGTDGDLQGIMKKKEPFEREIAEAMEKIAKLKQCIAFFEEPEEALKGKKQEYISAHNIAQHEVEKLRSQLVKATKNVLMELDRRRYEALNGIESTIRRLNSTQS